MTRSKRADRKAEQEARKLIKLEQDYRELLELRARVKQREGYLRKLLDDVATAEEY